MTRPDLAATLRRLMPASDDALFVAAVTGQRLVRLAAELLADTSKIEQHDRARAAIDTCTTIAAQLADVQDSLVEQLRADGHPVEVPSIDGPRQHHTIALRTVDVDAAAAIRRDLLDLGFEPWETWTGGALESFRRTASHFTVARTDTHTVVVRIEWRNSPRRNAPMRAVVPTAGDWYMVDLPRRAWWAYSAVRLFRLTTERLGIRKRHDGSLGPYLTTPDSLVDPLFEFAEITSLDIVADVGCGDGRLPIAAARRFGCHAIGVEHSPELVEQAVRAAERAGVDHLVEIRHGDARDSDLRSATVVFVFLPIDVAGDLVDGLLADIALGGRLVAHEQRGLPASVRVTSPPDVSRMLLGADGVTVAHRWNR